MLHYVKCPVCDSDNIHPQLTVRDHTVSQSVFSIWHCNGCTARFTQDAPDQSSIPAYYASEDYISHSDTKKGLINSLYHRVRKHTLNAKRRLVIRESGIEKGAVLDLGCGTGAFLHTMRKAGWDVTGIEPDLQARANATALYDITPLDPEKLYELKAECFHAITLWHVLEHVHDLKGYLKQLSVLLAPGGKLFIAVPNYTSYDAAVYSENWAAYDVPRHLYHFSPQSMKRLLSTFNLKLSNTRPMWFDSFYVSMLSEKYLNGKGNFMRAFWNGFLSNLKACRNPEKCSSLIYVAERI